MKPRYVGVNTDSVDGNYFIRQEALISPGDTYQLTYVRGGSSGSVSVDATKLDKATPHVYALGTYHTKVDGKFLSKHKDAFVWVSPVVRIGQTMVPLGVFFDDKAQQWMLYNEAQTAVPAGQYFLLWAPPNDPSSFVFTVSSKNPDGPARLPLDKVGKNDAVILTHRVTSGNILARPFSIAQEPDTGQWQIVTDKPLVEGTQFNVRVIKDVKR
jgi:hypothetical protein